MRGLLALLSIVVSPLTTFALPLPIVVPPHWLPPQFNIDDWTPRPATGKAEPWELATDKDWIDPRFREMNTGPFLNGTMEYPHGKGKERVFKATAIKLGEKGDAGVIFDRCTMRLAAGWTGGWLNHSDRRFGLMNTPRPAGTERFSLLTGSGWKDVVSKPPQTIPVPSATARYRGMYVHGDRVVLSYTIGECEVLECVTYRTVDGIPVLVRGINARHEGWNSKQFPALVAGRFHDGYDLRMGHAFFKDIGQGLREAIGVSDKPLNISAAMEDENLIVKNNAFLNGFAVQIAYARFKESEANKFSSFTEGLFRGEDLTPLTKPGPARWGKPIVTKLERGNSDGPFAVDTLTIPYDNPFKSLFFCTGVDVLPDGRVAMCTCHGDVWLAKVDEAANTVAWQRFATGLYHPLGLKVVDGKVVVLESGQLTRLHDNNADGEADFYECISNDWHTGGGEHSYDTCLETDTDGNFYFFKTGDTHVPHGGCLLKVAKDGSKTEVFATGFRHPIGMGMSSSNILTGADQEGNWMPATRIDEYKKGGFYGDMRGHHRDVPPATYDPPLCWLPREVDNSAGGQVWVPKGTWGELGGVPLHFSYGRCKAFVLLRQELKDGVQGGVADLDLHFLSGVCRGRFAPDGNLYVCGLNGWQTSAKADGCLQRVRYTGKPLDVPVKMAVEGNELRLTFSRPLDAKAATNLDNWRAAWWNYIWSKEYGSKRWKISDPNAEGQDDVPVRSVKVSDDGRTVVLGFDRLQPVMQMQVAYNIATGDAKKLAGSVFLTIHATK